MTDNETIHTKLFGKCWHEPSDKYHDPVELYCRKCGKWYICNKDYTLPAAWNQELWGVIAGSGLVQSFIDNLCDLTFKRNRMVYHMIWDCMSATEAQKARALARAIEEKK